MDSENAVHRPGGYRVTGDREMTNLQTLLSQAKSLSLITTTTVWNFHNCDHLDNLAKKQNTNIGQIVAQLKAKGEKGAFTIFVYRIGRSAHSPSQVAILRGTTNNNETSYYYTKRMGEFFIS